jgi:fused signal recognition particle receptor
VSGLVALAERFGLPVHAIGIGEQAEDLRPFAASDFARSLMGPARSWGPLAHGAGRLNL